MSYTLRIYDEVMGLAYLPAFDDVVDYLLLVVIIFLRDKNILGTGGNAAP